MQQSQLHCFCGLEEAEEAQREVGMCLSEDIPRVFLLGMLLVRAFTVN